MIVQYGNLKSYESFLQKLESLEGECIVYVSDDRGLFVTWTLGNQLNSYSEDLRALDTMTSDISGYSDAKDQAKAWIEDSDDDDDPDSSEDQD